MATITESIHDLAGKLEASEEGLVLDFSTVRRVDADALGALRQLAAEAAALSVKITLSSVNVTVYKVLKLTGLSSQFSFLN
jgi:anti-anti-sigma regulatory factor